MRSYVQPSLYQPCNLSNWQMPVAIKCLKISQFFSGLLIQLNSRFQNNPFDIPSVHLLTTYVIQNRACLDILKPPSTSLVFLGASVHWDMPETVLFAGISNNIFLRCLNHHTWLISIQRSGDTVSKFYQISPFHEEQDQLLCRETSFQLLALPFGLTFGLYPQFTIIAEDRDVGWPRRAASSCFTIPLHAKSAVPKAVCLLCSSLPSFVNRIQRYLHSSPNGRLKQKEVPSLWIWSCWFSCCFTVVIKHSMISIPQSIFSAAWQNAKI